MMNKQEMTKIFSLMMLNYPKAEMFKGGIEKLKPTIELWTACLPDVDFWTGQQALAKVFRENPFPPTIAEFKAQADNVHKEIKSTVNDYIQSIRTADMMFDSLDEFYRNLPKGDRLRMTIDMMGGVDNLTVTHEHNGQISCMWNWSEFERCYEKLLRSGNALMQKAPQALPRKETE